jgi:integrase
MNVDLPGRLYDPNRHGKPRWYVRIRGRKRRIEGIDCVPPFPATKTALAAYHAARKSLDGSRRRKGEGSFRWLAEEYMRSRTFARLNDLPQRERRSVLGRIVEKHGDKTLRADHAARRREAQRRARRASRQQAREGAALPVQWAVEAGNAAGNPAADVPLLKVGSAGYTPWTREDVLQFEGRHPIGTKARLALALHLYTGQRRSDVVQWGPLNAKGARLVYVQHKGRGQKPKRRDIPLVAPLRAILDASPLGATTWLETEQGRPFTIAGYGNWFRDRCVEAGLAVRSHGLRKLVGIMAAERGATAHEIMQILGHDSLGEAERYTREASARKLGDAGFDKVFGTEQE